MENLAVKDMTLLDRLTRYSKNSPTSLGGEMNCKKMRENTCSNVPDVVQYNQSNKRKD